MKKIYNLLLLATLLCLGSCSDFLDFKPNGILDETDINGVDQAEAMVIAAYSMLGNDHYDQPFSLWPYGNVRSDDAYKGGRDEADIQAFHFYETSLNILPDFGEPDALWFQFYIGIARCNKAINILKELTLADFPNRDVRIAECRFIRSHFYFMLKIMYKYIPYIDESVHTDDYNTISNREYDNDGLWGMIAKDFEKAYEDLPEKREDIGRPDKIAAAAYLAKTYLYKAYQQDEKHDVTNISTDDLNQVIKYSDIVIGSSYDLESDFARNFLPGSYENGIESVWAIQFSKDDGTKFGRLNFSDVLNVPLGFTGACDFHKPSQNLVNAFKTSDGLPLFYDYNKQDYQKENDYADPRLFHTVALPGLPYKYDTTTLFQNSWTRNPLYGYYSSLKENVQLNDPHSVLIDPFRANSKNRIVLRYSDILLMKAEALIELNLEREALSLINAVRQRAEESVQLIPYASLADIRPYENNATWTQSYARQALRWERRLEFAMEGSRFFDLVRWGIADEVLNTYYQEESPKVSYYKEAHFDKNKAEYVPIPQNQINFSKKVYKQNYNY